VQKKGARCAEKNYTLSEEVESDFYAEKCSVTGSGEDHFTRQDYYGYDVGRESHEVAFRGSKKCGDALSIDSLELRYNRGSGEDSNVL
jgi:hypothetical protein